MVNQDEFSKSILSTIGVDFKVLPVKVDDRDVKIQLIDTSGQERYSSIITGYCPRTSLFVFVFSVNDRSSFQSIEDTWLQTIDLFPDVPRVLIANKIDVNYSSVTIAEIQEFSEKHKFTSCFQVSAKDNTNIQTLAPKLVKIIFKANKTEIEEGDINVQKQLNVVENSISKLNFSKTFTNLNEDQTKYQTKLISLGNSNSGKDALLSSFFPLEGVMTDFKTKKECWMVLQGDMLIQYTNESKTTIIAKYNLSDDSIWVVCTGENENEIILFPIYSTSKSPVVHLQCNTNRALWIEKLQSAAYHSLRIGIEINIHQIPFTFPSNSDTLHSLQVFTWDFGINDSSYFHFTGSLELNNSQTLSKRSVFILSYNMNDEQNGVQSLEGYIKSFGELKKRFSQNKHGKQFSVFIIGTYDEESSPETNNSQSIQIQTLCSKYDFLYDGYFQINLKTLNNLDVIRKKIVEEVSTHSYLSNPITSNEIQVGFELEHQRSYLQKKNAIPILDIPSIQSQTKIENFQGCLNFFQEIGHCYIFQDYVVLDPLFLSREYLLQIFDPFYRMLIKQSGVLDYTLFSEFWGRNFRYHPNILLSLAEQFQHCFFLKNEQKILVPFYFSETPDENFETLFPLEKSEESLQFERIVALRYARFDDIVRKFLNFFESHNLNLLVIWKYGILLQKGTIKIYLQKNNRRAEFFIREESIEINQTNRLNILEKNILIPLSDFFKKESFEDFVRSPYSKDGLISVKSCLNDIRTKQRTVYCPDSLQPIIAETLLINNGYIPPCSIKIFVLFKEESFDFKISVQSSTYYLKLQIEEILNIDTFQQQLFFGERELLDEEYLFSFDLKEGSSIHLRLRDQKDLHSILVRLKENEIHSKFKEIIEKDQSLIQIIQDQNLNDDQFDDFVVKTVKGFDTLIEDDVGSLGWNKNRALLIGRLREKLIKNKKKDNLFLELVENGVPVSRKELEDQEILLLTKKNYVLKDEHLTLQPQELLAAWAYTVESYQLYSKINATLRNCFNSIGSTEEDIEKKEKQFLSWIVSIRLLSNAVTVIKGHKGRVYRGENIKYEPSHFQENEILFWPSFTSCSRMKSQAQGFVKSEGVLYEIILNREFGASVEGFSFFGSEKEVILPPFTTFKILKVYQDPAKFGVKYYVRLELVESHDTSSKISLPPGILQESFEAIEADNLGFFKENLLYIFPMINQQSEKGETLLYVASKLGKMKIVHWLLNNGANINSVDSNGSTPIHGAALGKHSEVMKLLILRGADLSIRNNQRLTVKQESKMIYTKVVDDLRRDLPWWKKILSYFLW